MNHVHKPPQHVTRFYGNVDYALDVIANRQITFTHVSTLNDPFDPYFFFETDFGQSRERLLKHVKHSHPGDFVWFKKKVTAQSWDKAMKHVEAKIASWRDNTFVFSTSGECDGAQPRDNLYMWGHYGNGHRGVAIEFDTQELSTSVLKHHQNVNGAALVADEVWARVEYKKEFAPITADDYYEFLKATENDTRVDTYIRLMARVKNEVWQRENEWRLMWGNPGTRMKIYRCPINAASITTVLLGLRLGEASRQDFVAETKQNFPGAKVLRAKKRHGDIALEFE
jgi:hypothetical protein